MIRVKDGVKFSVLREEIYKHFSLFEKIFAEHNAQCWITCGTDAHPADDPHTNGFAVDIRSHDLSDEASHDVLIKLRNALGKDYTILLENEGLDSEHFHCQLSKQIWRDRL